MKKTMLVAVCALLFAGYLLLLIYFLFFSEQFGRGHVKDAYAYNLVPFREIGRFLAHARELGMAAVLANLVGNVSGFVPFGAILPILARWARGPVRVGLLTFGFSLLVECAQLVCKVGSFDVDDLMLNTLGGVAGYFLFAACARIRRRYGKKNHVLV